ncbi:unnamed protein product [Nesidiocoris tenuis]|uniref:Uncharacterized protein n=1 Tax=Nesidiocoris tenuis TaxID=355587 RepID=A0A6H5H3D6_9HEMI|nr:unnamed protein product [Nesidiocoris tenuis]
MVELKFGKLVQVGQPSTHSGQQPNLSQANYPRQQDTAAQPTSQPASLPYQPCNQAQQPHAGQQVGPNNYPPLTGQVPNFGPQNPPNQQFASYLGPQPNYGQLPSPENRFQGPPPPIPVSTPYPANVPPAPNTATDYLGGPIRMHPVQHQPFMHPGPPPMQPPPPYHPIGQPLFNQGARMNHPYTPPQYQRGRGGYNGRGNRGNQNNRNVRQAGPNQWNNKQQNQNRIPPQNANKNAAQNKGNPGSNSSESDISDKKSNPSQKKGQPNAGKGGKIASEANKSNKNENKGPGNQAGGAQKSGGPQEAKNQQKKKKERALFLQSDGVQADNK